MRPALAIRMLPFRSLALAVTFAVRRAALKTIILKNNYFDLRENSAAGAPLRAFRGVTPGLRACKAPVQQRPTAPNIVKMAEGGMGQRLASLYTVPLAPHTAHAFQTWRHGN